MPIDEIIKILTQVLADYAAYEAGNPVSIGPYDVELGGNKAALTLTIKKA